MIRYLTFSSRGRGRVGQARLRYQVKTSRFDGTVVHDEYIGVRDCVVVEGGAQSGKSRALSRVRDRAEVYWGSERRRRARGPVRVLLISGRESLHDWLAAVAAAGCPPPDGQVWARMTQAARIAAAIDWITADDVRVLIDDAHLVPPGSRREAVVVSALRAARVWWITTSQVERLPQSVRMVVLSRGPRVVSLGTTASYDHTLILTWGLLMVCVAAGAYEVAGLLSLLMLMRRGRGAAKENG